MTDARPSPHDPAPPSTLPTDTPACLPVMIGTAGHVDHGKSSLVQWLTGGVCKLDRRPEERSRGLTIDLGFGALAMPDGRVAGIVDVPGHEDFIRNMAAGASSVDILLLVVAADDGVMPQTREHMRIVSLLRAPQLLVALTKTDLADPELVDLAAADVRTFLAETGYPDAPILPVSNRTGRGIDILRQTLTDMVLRHTPAPDPRAFRMHVERTFSIRGYGTVLTGVPVSGYAARGDTLTLLPDGSPCRVRAVQSYRRDVDAAVAHACAAVNLRDLDASTPTRGMTLAAPCYDATTFLLAAIRHVGGTLRFRQTFRMMLHAGTAAVQVSVRLLDTDAFPPGTEALAHIRLEDPLGLCAGDPFLLRSLSPVTTIGGGVVLSVRERRIRRTAPHLLPALQAAREAVSRRHGFDAELLAGPDALLDESTLLRLTRAPEAVGRTLLQDAEAEGVLLALGSGAYLVAARAGDVADHLTRALTRYHAAHPYEWGMEPTHAARLLDIPASALRPLLRHLGTEAAIHMHHGRLAMTSFAPMLSARQIEWWEGIRARVREDVSTPPARGDLSKTLGIPATEMRMLERLLADEGAILVVGTHYFDPEAVAGYRVRARDILAREGILQVPAFRDATGLGRNIAIALLERFDAEGLTRRTDDGRVAGDAASSDTQA